MLSKTPFCRAILKGRLAVAQKLEQLGGVGEYLTCSNPARPILKSLLGSSLELFRWAITVLPWLTDDPVILKAAKINQAEKLRILIESRATPSSRKTMETALQYAIRGRAVDSIRYLATIPGIVKDNQHLAALPGPDNGGCIGTTPVCYTLEYHYTSAKIQADLITILEIFLELDPDQLDRADTRGSTPLHLATVHGMRRVMSFLAGRGSQAHNTVNAFGNTPLHAAANVNGSETLAHLLQLYSYPPGELGIDRTNNFGSFPLIQVFQLGSRDSREIEKFQLLVAAGARAFNKAGRNDVTPLSSIIDTYCSDKPAKLLAFLKSGFCYGLEVDVGAIRTAVENCIDPYNKDKETDTEVAQILYATGAIPDSYQFPISLIPTEDQVADWRYQIYFRRSLVGDLLRELRSSS